MFLINNGCSHWISQSFVCVRLYEHSNGQIKKKMEKSTELSPWVTFHALLIPPGELPWKYPEAHQNPKSLGGSGVDREME